MIKKLIVAVIIIFVALSIFAYNKITIFAVQPIGALPEGATVVMWKKGNMRFFESPDGMCLQSTGGVSLFCRLAALGNGIDKDNVIFRLPYIEYVYLQSTDGRKFGG
ncbi:hypothetical protein KKJ06_19495 [Xenorhabdus bovienii]|uniref:Uncharacterized protein n=4 Tax=Xenorhabdus TaxID=626 RepID=A0AAJ1J9N5_XENBV|nr:MULTISPECIES: hypothetical protein [Xenorhabdus]CDH05749.1 conserved exported hypothetical protein [Xenorhabdus bovienii str. oregonense]MDC9623818.1 hypothetical protein [Xenorhabdus aichiensis]MDE1479690.1 hypothetical protein [Xenorhabdus bovienii]MDE1492819.1 hypothetical protein [Xenorhabdus bovienii]MDE9443019.1 hypothetical protein [Xenorhabdus bovienii]